MKIIAHRGASDCAPENTLKAFQRALDLGADMLECDVYVLSDGEVVVMHDHKVDRTTNGEGYVFEHDFATLRQLNAGHNEKVPTLQEVMNLVDQQIPINIELKGPGTAIPVARIIRNYTAKRGWTRDDVLVSSFDHHELKLFKRYAPQIPIAALINAIPLDYAQFAEGLGAAAINPNREFINQAYVDDAHARGLKVYAYVVDDPDEIVRMYQLGVDGIFCNAPDKAREVVTALQQVGADSHPLSLRLAAASVRA